MKTRLLTAAILILAAAFALSCNAKASLDNGNINGEATLPLLPFDLPIFPTDVTLEGAGDSLKNWAQDNLPSWVPTPSKSAIESTFSQIEDMLRNASLQILQPGVVSTAVDNQVTEAINTYIKITSIGVNFSFANETDVYVAVPVEFRLYIGAKDLAEACGNATDPSQCDDSVIVHFVSDRVQSDGRFIVKPGETIDLSVPNMPSLVDSLNALKPIGVGYKALYRAADTDNGADVAGIAEKFGGCILSQVVGIDVGQCPTVDQLIHWHLTLKKFDLVIKASTDFNIPPIPGCKDFANNLNLDLLKNACPAESSSGN